MKIGLIDVDSHNFPNLALMKISAYHKAHGDSVKWWENGLERYDQVYVSRVFDDTYTSWQEPIINAEVVHYGGTGIDLKNKLPAEIEQQCPDYSLYLKFDEAYGFLTRGCPRNCQFCVVRRKEGRCSHQVSDLSEFHRGQKTIKLLDPNILACKDHEKLLQQLIHCKTWIDFTQGLDARLLNADNISLLQQIKTKMLHFAWDNDNEKDSSIILKSLQRFKRITDIDERKAQVYILTNFNTSFEFDLYRVNTLRAIGFTPYVMIYDKGAYLNENGRLLPMTELLEKFTYIQIVHFLKTWRLQRWVNNKRIFRTILRFEEYDPKIG